MCENRTKLSGINNKPASPFVDWIIFQDILEIASVSFWFFWIIGIIFLSIEIREASLAIYAWHHFSTN
jgi:hypothetical protein